MSGPAGRSVAPHPRPRLATPPGVPATGQSTAARHAAARLGAIVVRPAAVRKRLGGVPLRERVAPAFGEALYTPEMGRRTYVGAARLADELLRAGWPVIVDGSFSHAAELEALELGQPHVQRQLAALEAGGHVLPGAGALGAATGGLALGPLAATHPGLGRLRTGSRAKVVDLNRH